LALIQTDTELSEIFMRAFILRRVELIARGLGDVVLVGSSHSAGTLRIKEFLMRNGHPYSYIDLERDSDVEHLLDRFHVAAADVPVVICRGELVLRNPTNQQIAECLGFNDAIDQTHVRDLVILGAGLSGRARCSGAGDELARGAGRFEFEDRKLLGIPEWYFGSGTCDAGVRTGAEVRRASRHREGRQAAHLRP
jgi:thioredoxin reductase (NADPH)